MEGDSPQRGDSGFRSPVLSDGFSSYFFLASSGCIVPGAGRTTFEAGTTGGGGDGGPSFESECSSCAAGFSVAGSSGSQPAIESARAARIDPARRESFTVETPKEGDECGRDRASDQDAADYSRPTDGHATLVAGLDLRPTVRCRLLALPGNRTKSRPTTGPTPTMSLLSLLAASALLLALPIAIRPRSREAWEFHGFVAFLWYLNVAYCRLIHRLKSDPSPLPATGPAILIANHTCNIDHFLLQATTGRMLGFLISRAYYDVPAFRPFCRLVDCIPVNSDGKDSGATRAALRALKAGRVLPIFPEGQMNPTSGHEILEAKPGVAFIATRAKVPVVPAYIRGTPASRKVFISLITPSRSRIYYGEPIDPSHFEIPEGHDAQRAALVATTAVMMGAIRALKDRAEREEAEDSGR
jgi:1-acyl-sn-glycerol-3-phosphate acyltransferase